MTQLRKLILATAGGSIAALVLVTGALAAYSLFGDAEIVSPGNGSAQAVQLRSDDDPGFGGVDFDIADGTTFADLNALSTEYWFEADDSCGGGSPRFQVNVVDPDTSDEGSIFVYIGPPPNYTDCPSGTWLNTGDLLEGANLIDTTQLEGGAFYDPYASALAKYGGYTVTGVQLVVDAGWFFLDGEQTARFDNTIVDEALYTYDEAMTKDDCKRGGWQDLTDDEGNSFRNQGDCVSFVATGGKNRAAGN